MDVRDMRLSLMVSPFDEQKGAPASGRSYTAE